MYVRIQGPILGIHLVPIPLHFKRFAKIQNIKVDMRNMSAIDSFL